MNSNTRKKLQHFVGKPCTVFTQPVQKMMSGQEFNDYFVGVVEFLDEDGLWTVHPVTNCKNFFPWLAIQGIAEEQVLRPEDPGAEQLIQELKAKGAVSNENPYADLAMLEDIKRQAN